jgi:O-6-methylguanine DNA methyltransferase
VLPAHRTRKLEFAHRFALHHPTAAQLGQFLFYTDERLRHPWEEKGSWPDGAKGLFFANMNSERESLDNIWELPIQTRDGEFMAHYSEKGLCGLDFPSRDAQQKGRMNGGKIPAEIQSWHRETTRALENALAGRLVKELPPLDLSRGTDFQQRVWRVLKSIACGKTVSYGEVADEIGDRKAVRAVGRACGANPIPVLIPCHRVLASNQRIGGFSGGLDWKRRLLAREGVLLLE